MGHTCIPGIQSYLCVVLFSVAFLLNGVILWSCFYLGCPELSSSVQTCAHFIYEFPREYFQLGTPVEPADAERHLTMNLAGAGAQTLLCYVSGWITSNCSHSILFKRMLCYFFLVLRKVGAYTSLKIKTEFIKMFSLYPLISIEKTWFPGSNLHFLLKCSSKINLHVLKLVFDTESCWNCLSCYIVNDIYDIINLFPFQ